MSSPSHFRQPIDKPLQGIRVIDLTRLLPEPGATMRLADVVVESARPSVMDKPGVGWHVLKERNPRLVVCPMSGYGNDGPLSKLAGHGINCIGMAMHSKHPTEGKYWAIGPAIKFHS